MNIDIIKIFNEKMGYLFCDLFEDNNFSLKPITLFGIKFKLNNSKLIFHNIECRHFAYNNSYKNFLSMIGNK